MEGFGHTFGKKKLECFLNITNPLIVSDLPYYEKEQLIKFLADNTPDYFIDNNIPRLEGYSKKIEEYYSEILSDILNKTFISQETEELRSSLLSSYEYQEFLDTGNIDCLKDCDLFEELKNKKEFLDLCVDNGLTEYIFMNPYSIEDLTSDNFHYGYWQDFSHQITNWAKDNGYDAILSEKNENNKIREIVVFYPNQIKSIDNLYPTNDDNFKDNKDAYFFKASLDEKLTAASEKAAIMNDGKDYKSHDDLEL